MGWHRILVLGPVVSLSLATACATQLQAPEVSEAARLREERLQREMILSMQWERERRLFEVGSRLKVAGAELCGDDVRPAYGMVVRRIDEFPEEYRAAAKRVFRHGERLTIWHVVPGLPAQRSGLQAGDIVVEVNGQSVQETEDLTRRLAGSQGHVEMIFLRGGRRWRARIQPVPGCSHPLELVTDDSVNAFADGTRVVVTQGMMRFAQRDEELALVVGHEIAHNALGHMGRKRANQIGGMILGGVLDVAVAAGGVNSGGAGMNLGASLGATAFSQDFESEADYMGCYLAARASFDVSDAAMFWRRMAIEHPGAVKKNYLSTHPSTPERSVRLERTVAEISHKRETRTALLPRRKGKE